MQKIVGLALILIGVSAGFFVGMMFQTPQNSQNPQTGTEGRVTLTDVRCHFTSEADPKLEVELENDFADRTLRGNVIVFQDGKQWTGEVDWHFSGYGYTKMYCDSLQEDKDLRIQYIDNYQDTIYLDRVIEWNDVAVTYTFTFRGTEQLEIQGASWGGTSGDAANTVTLSVQNTGTANLTIDKYKLGVGGTQNDITDVHVPQGGTASVTCTTGADGIPWTSGTTYDIYAITSTGKQFPYRATAP